jgi:hypothetical protein
MKTFYPSILTANEVHTSTSRMDSIIIGNITNDTYITKVDLLLKKPLANLSTALGRSIDSTQVELLGKKNELRDLRYIGLRDFCKALSVDTDPALAAAGAYLVNIFKDIGWSLQNEGYIKQSSLLKALIDKLEKTPASTALTTIGAVARFTELKTAQTDFEVTYKTKVDAKTQEEYPKIRDCRISIVRYLGAMLSYVDMMDEIEGGNFSTTVNQIDEVITEFDTIARNRITRKKNEKTKPAEGNTTTTTKAS